MKKWSQSKTNRERGKRHERAIAKLFGGKRRGVLGGEDVEHSYFSIECKSRERICTEKWMEQCEANNKEGKIPLLVTHIFSKDYKRDIVGVRVEDLDDFVDAYVKWRGNGSKR